MNVFKDDLVYRNFGIGRGVPMFVVDFGPGRTLSVEGLVSELAKKGLNVNRWVVLRNKPLSEKGIVTLIDGLISLKCKLEVEVDGDIEAPPWLSKVTRWIVNWKFPHNFDYKLLRPKQDILLYKGSKIEQFLDETSFTGALRVIVTEDPKNIWDIVKDLEVRVYHKRDIEEY